MNIARSIMPCSKDCRAPCDRELRVKHEEKGQTHRQAVEELTADQYASENRKGKMLFACMPPNAISPCCNTEEVRRASNNRS